MKTNELRIGNFVYDIHRGIVVDVHLNVLRSIKTNKTCLYQSIPLTEEWLEKFGFTKAIYYDVDQNYYVYFDFSIYNFYDEGWFFLDPDNGHINTKGVKYVHELQNLYFALTGEELKMKELDESKK